MSAIASGAAEMLADESVIVDVQIASSVASVPDNVVIQNWVRSAVTEVDAARLCEVSVRIVDESEGRSLNNQYRGKDYATNVLAFPADGIAEMLTSECHSILGDIVVCGPVVEREAADQGKVLADHWLHLLIHGTLHLLGFDHESDSDAAEMEQIEIQLLGRHGISDPYVA